MSSPFAEIVNLKKEIKVLKTMSNLTDEEIIQYHITIVNNFIQHARCMIKCKCPAKVDAIASMNWLENYFKTK